WLLADFLGDPDSVLNALVEGCVAAANVPDVAVALDAPATVSGADPFTVTVTASNPAAVDLTGVSAVVTLPTGLVLDTTPAGAVYDAVARTVTWTVGSLGAGVDTT